MIYLPTPSLKWGTLQNSYWLKNLWRKKKKNGGNCWVSKQLLHIRRIKWSCVTLWSNGFLHAVHTHPRKRCWATISAPSLGSAHPPHLRCNSLSGWSWVVGLTPTAPAVSYCWPPVRCQWNMSIEWWAEQTTSPGSCWQLSVLKSGNGSTQDHRSTAGPRCLWPQQRTAG